MHSGCGFVFEVVPNATKLYTYHTGDTSGMRAPTEYAVAHGACQSRSYTADAMGTGWRWLRSPGEDSGFAACVNVDGVVNSSGINVLCKSGCVRPVVCILLSEGFTGTLNGFLRHRNLDVYVTGSNSRFLSSDIASEFKGRGSVIHVFPLTFREYCEGLHLEPLRAWPDCLETGGIPLAALMKTRNERMHYLKNLSRIRKTA